MLWNKRGPAVLPTTSHGDMSQNSTIVHPGLAKFKIPTRENTTEPDDSNHLVTEFQPSDQNRNIITHKRA